jgi:hypothetical protein
MIIKNVKFSYAIKKYHVGPYIDFMAELEVPSLEYDSIVNAIQEARPRYEQIQLMCYSRK